MALIDEAVGYCLNLATKADGQLCRGVDGGCILVCGGEPLLVVKLVDHWL